MSQRYLSSTGQVLQNRDIAIVLGSGVTKACNRLNASGNAFLVPPKAALSCRG